LNLILVDPRNEDADYVLQTPESELDCFHL